MPSLLWCLAVVGQAHLSSLSPAELMWCCRTKEGWREEVGKLAPSAFVVALVLWCAPLIGPSGALQITSATLPKGKFVKFQPQSSNFLEISNHKAVLENSLRHFSALTARVKPSLR